MTENIDGTPTGTGLFNTKIPALSDAADIQAALRLYHYGLYAYDAANPTSTSIAGHLKALDTRLDAQETLGVGSEYSATIPPSPVEGFIWVDSTSTPSVTQVVSTSNYQTTAPTTGLTQGMLWVDSDSSPLKMYVYSGTAWLEIGA
jgi:hypothetical protein